MSLINDLIDLRHGCMNNTPMDLEVEENPKIFLKWGKIAFTNIKSGKEIKRSEEILDVCISNLLLAELDIYQKALVVEFITPILEFYSTDKDTVPISDLISDEHFKKLRQN